MGVKEGSNNFIIGILVGAASMLPGISGGVIAVIFRIYERLIYDVNHIRTKIREDFWFLAVVLLGILAGMIAFVFITDYLLNTWFIATMFLFVGLIIGQLPELVKITKKGEPTKISHIVWLAVGLAVMVFLLILHLQFGEADEGAAIEDSGIIIGIVLAFIVGAILALSKIVPGISGSTVLLALGLYIWMLDMIKGFDLLYLIPFGIGFIAAVFGGAKLMGHLLENYHHPVYYFILGLTVGSVFVIAAMAGIENMTDVLTGCAAAAAGVLISFALTKIRRSDTVSG
ncbi:MAG: DUF368 domain-containing protein [Methanomassiliicoccaceae archaeon]|nr:DUF368 domain-containing protein [Methanomassiliicoccaceae archaeon]